MELGRLGGRLQWLLQLAIASRAQDLTKGQAPCGWHHLRTRAGDCQGPMTLTAELPAWRYSCCALTSQPHGGTSVPMYPPLLALSSVPPRTWLPAPQTLPRKDVEGAGQAKGRPGQDGGPENHMLTTDLGPPTVKWPRKPAGSGRHSVSWPVTEPRTLAPPPGGPCLHAADRLPSPLLPPRPSPSLLPSFSWMETVSQDRLPLLHSPYRLPNRASCRNDGRTQASFTQPPTPRDPTL